MEGLEALALDALALAEPTSLADSSRLTELHARCSAAGLCGPPADGNLVASLHSLFDVALKNNLVSLVLHYIAEARRRPAPPLPLPLSPLPPGLSGPARRVQ